MQCDVTNEKIVKYIFESIEVKFPKIPILANVAGVVRYGKIDEISEEDWNYQIKTNLKSICFLP